MIKEKMLEYLMIAEILKEHNRITPLEETLLRERYLELQDEFIREKRLI